MCPDLQGSPANAALFCRDRLTTILSFVHPFILKNGGKRKRDNNEGRKGIRMRQSKEGLGVSGEVWD